MRSKNDEKERAKSSDGQGTINFPDYDGLSGSKPKRSVRVKPMGKGEGEEGMRAEYSICITSCRVNLLDPDNYYIKDLIDQLRYAGVIPEDDPQTVEIEIIPKKVSGYKQEKTIIEVRRNGN